MSRRLLRTFFALLVATVVAGALVGAAGQAPSVTGPAAATAALTDRIPVDPQITTGRLPNGLRYYVRANKKPEGRAELRLAVNAGSVLEEDDQRGLAHMVEHMAFNGTKNFPKMDIVNFMESIGMRFGNDVNAYTGFDETVYMLQIPTDKPAIMDRAMLILEDWAQNVTFDPAEIDKERGVVTEEWRLGRGANARMQDKQFPILLQGSRYADRLPIGLPETLRTFKPERLTQFYKDWYRPDLMAVVAVGDFDKTAIEALIKNHFSSIPAAANPKPRPKFDVPGHAGTTYAIVTDKEANNTRVTVYNTIAARDQSTIGAYREQQIIDHLFTDMLNARFGEIGQKPGAPFLGAGAQRGLLVRTTEASILIAAVRDSGVEAGLDSLFSEATRVAKFGFTQTEFDREKADVLRGYERAVIEKDNSVSANLAAEYIRNFTTDEPIPGIVYENELYKRFLPSVTLAEINALAKEWSPDKNRVVLVNAPDKPGVTVPTEAKLAAVMAGAEGKSLTAYADTVSTAPLMERAPVPGKIATTATKPAYGITEWTLSNGVRVVMRPTTFKADEILMRAYSPGGTSLASDRDLTIAETAGQVVGAGGVGKLSLVDLRKAMTGKVASVGASIGDYSEDLSGGASPQDLESLFQMIYLRFTAPRADPEVFSVITDQMKVGLANQKSQPEFAFSEALNAALWNNHPRSQMMTVERVDEMNLQKSMAFYKERFADASDFTFVFVGSFQPEMLRPFAEKYLASLPSTGRKETWKDTGMRPAKGIVNKRVEKGIDPKSQTRIVFTGPFQFDQAHRATLRAMSMSLEGVLRNLLREDLGGTYGVSVSASAAKIPVPGYTITVSFGSAPNNTDSLVANVFQKIVELKETGPAQQDVDNIKQILTREYETNSKQNGFLLREISSRYQLGEDVADLFRLPDIYSKITAEQIQAAARQYFNMNNYVRVELFPEK